MEPLCPGASKSIVPENLRGSPTGLGLPRYVLLMIMMMIMTIVMMMTMICRDNLYRPGASQVRTHDDDDDDHDDHDHDDYDDDDSYVQA